MTKARTKGEKLRAKKAALPGLAATPKRDRNGCFVERTRQQAEEPPARLNLDRRAREMGESPEAGKAGDKVRAKYAAPVYGEDATKALTVYREARKKEGKSDCGELIELYGDFCARYAAWCRSLGIRPHAKCSKSEMMPEPFEVDPSARPDLRTQEERDIAAARGYEPYARALKQIGPMHEQAIWRAYAGYRALHTTGELTLSGRLFVAAMKAMNEVMK